MLQSVYHGLFIVKRHYRNMYRLDHFILETYGVKSVIESEMELFVRNNEGSADTLVSLGCL